MSLEKAINRLHDSHPACRFFQVGEVAAGRTDTEENDQKFQYVSLYEHKITNSFERLGGHNFIISNGFLASHTYNLALVWLWYNRPGNNTANQLDSALRHNFKKFFAECALAKNNCLIARALLIETLVYEQDLMRPIFEAIQTDPALAEMAADIAHLMTSALSHHELGHYFLHRSPQEFQTHIQAFFGASFNKLIAETTLSHDASFAEEIICDALAVQLAISDNDETLSKYDNITRARMVAFHFMVFKNLVSLEKSAHATAEHCSEEDTAINLSSEKRPRVQFSFQQGKCHDTEFRAKEIIKLIEAVCIQQGDVLFIDNVFFFLFPHQH